MYFLELLNFQRVSEDLSKILHDQLKPNSGTKVRWVRWTDQMQSLVAKPDITLICTLNLSRTTLKFLANEARGSSVVIYGEIKPIMELPILPSLKNLDKLLEYIAVPKNELPLHITTEPLPHQSSQSFDWKRTVPLQLNTQF